LHLRPQPQNPMPGTQGIFKETNDYHFFYGTMTT
jgi:hypothetical protein